MQKDFHYYATYAAAFLAGYSHEDSVTVAYSAQFVDDCSRSLLRKLKGPMNAASTQLQMELMDANTDIMGLQDITRIWSSFHFLPKDLYAEKSHCGRRYLNKYRLIAGPNGELVKDTVELAKGKSLQAAGIAMHVVADTWAHANFAGTPSLVINNTNYHFFEIFPDGQEKEISFRHNPTAPDDVDEGLYTNSLYQSDENSIMNLGHGRAGHLPDYSFCRYKYLPAWADYREVVKDNPSDYRHAFRQLVHAMKYLNGSIEGFSLNTYDDEAVRGHEPQIRRIIEKRQIDACADWKSFGEGLSGQEIPDFSIETWQKEYMEAKKEEKKETFLGKFFEGTLAQKSMVTSRIFQSGNLLAGYSIDPETGKLLKKMVKGVMGNE